jgi:uncharacterized protein
VSDADWKFRQNASQFARQGYDIHGDLTAALLTRVADGEAGVKSVSGAVHSLDHSASGRPGFEVSVAGLLGLTCQSCGAAFDLAVDSASIIHVARDTAELASWEDETFESIEATEKTSALELVEDELLLSIPYVPRCPKCAADDTPRTHEFS